ncbi:cell division protein ZapA [Altererythrobacter aerius]|uniref:Cell division protein ZapA n=1 Tax=Tsuneonella aeria TaxID=1837929 RepID=A0A6I4TCR8_9SPHN|nr:cell division protein ZapA [Tsuneonella aeria]MXO73950.1 cell division protein ZapA [Tsuneonella aeria]
MSEVALSVGGRIFRVACAAGEEDRVIRLGALVSDKLVALGNLSGHEAQNLLFAALILADEAHQPHAAEDRDGANAEREMEAARTRQSDEPARAASVNEALQGELAAARKHAEDLSSRLASVTSERDELAAHVQALGTADQAPQMADLAPALERLAQMLEECADKLESGRPNT